MMCFESFHRDVVIAIYDSRLNLVHVHLESGLVGVLQALRSGFNIDVICLEEVRRHVLDSWRAINFERFLSSHNPRRKHYVSKPEGVVGMQMRDKADFEICRLQTHDTFVASCGGTPNDP